MRSNLLRPTFYEGQILGSRDLHRSVEYARDQDARHERYLHTWRLAEGLELKEQNGEWFLTAGFAIDSAGAPIVVPQPLLIDEDQLHDDALPSARDDGKWFPAGHQQPLHVSLCQRILGHFLPLLLEARTWTLDSFGGVFDQPLVFHGEVQHPPYIGKIGANLPIGDLRGPQP